MRDVESFFHHILFERKVDFHPDDMFEEYVSMEGESIPSHLNSVPFILF